MSALTQRLPVRKACSNVTFFRWPKGRGLRGLGWHGPGVPHRWANVPVLCLQAPPVCYVGPSMVRFTLVRFSACLRCAHVRLC